MALLDLFISLNKRDVTLSVVNVDHGIRGRASEEDSEFVKNYCKERNIPVFFKKVDSITYAKEHSLSVEVAARELRIGYFKSLLSSGAVDRIAFAHHLDDQCETIMMRILRGTGIDGLVGMKEKDGFIRPLLNVSRKEINEYVERNHIPFREDESNSDVVYSRNFLRNRILPELATRWNYRRSLVSLSRNSAEISDLLDMLSRKAYYLDDGALALDVDGYQDMHVAVLKHSIRRAAAHFNGGVDFEEKNLSDLIKLCGAKNGASVNIAGGIRVWQEYGKLVFDRERRADDVLPLSIGSFSFGDLDWEIKPREEETLRFDIDAIPKNAVIRSMRRGDVFQKFGGYTLPLGDFYTNIKVPLRLRGILPVIAADNEVLVTPFEISEKVKVEQGGFTLVRSHIKTQRSK